jgi:hypothetical protein
MVTDTTPTVAVDSADTLAAGDTTDTATASDSAAAPAPGTTTPAPTTPEQTRTPSPDTTPAATPSPTGPPGGDVAAVPATFIAIEGLAVDDVAPNRYQRRTGIRAVQRLASGNQVVVESYVLDSDTTGLGPVGTVRLIPTGGDTVLGIVRLENYLVRVLAPLPQDSVRTLMGRLAEREQ